MAVLHSPGKHTVKWKCAILIHFLKLLLWWPGLCKLVIKTSKKHLECTNSGLGDTCLYPSPREVETRNSRIPDQVAWAIWDPVRQKNQPQPKTEKRKKYRIRQPFGQGGCNSSTQKAGARWQSFKMASSYIERPVSEKRTKKSTTSLDCFLSTV